MIFKPPLNVEVTNFKTSEIWQMFSVDSTFVAKNEDLERIKTICNEPLVYKWLFKENLRNKPYTLEKAKGFIDWAHDGWNKQEYFVFLIKDIQGVIQAAIDVKSNNVDKAEVGYWASGDKPGIMTNVVKILCDLAKQAGYKGLFSDVQVTNEKSGKVLERINFSLEEELTKDYKQYYRYSKKLA